MKRNTLAFALRFASLQVGDSIHVDGDLQRDVIVVERITLLKRIERR
ncbi:MAG TPA: hypothetical protein VFM36_05290 [Thermoanaerobaculia bacterium]|nr:hypothetical protein [Thermoanaerobaculia bacterium]